MCGIVGTVGNANAAAAIYKSLKILEYRGYDSAGIAAIVAGRILVRKGVGKLSEVEEACGLSSLPGTLGIGHVRWATHGKVTPENAHPHFDCSHRIALVHNGVIENFQELHRSCAGRHQFTSETDTEIIAHLIEDELFSPDPEKQDPAAGSPSISLERAVYNVTRRLQGSYAILVISTLEPDKIVAARRDSPLVIGIGRQGNFLASDVLCFLDQTDQAIYVNDGETVALTDKSVTIFDSRFTAVRREPVQLDYRCEEATKQGHEHFMKKEILEQPHSIRQALKQDSKAVMGMTLDMLRARQVVLTGCGTSRHAALIGRYAFSRLAGILSEVVMGSEFQYFSDSVDKCTAVLAISQSGETADVIQGVKKARDNSAKIFSVVNTRGSTLDRLSDRTLHLRCGPEIAVAATKSFISQLTIFYMLSFAMIDRLAEGVEKLNAISNLIEDNLKLNGSGLDRLAVELASKKDFYFIGRGINFAVAGEGALKLKEVSYVHAEGMSAGELKHGTLALIEPGTPVVAICPTDYTYAETLSNVQETKARGAFVIGVSDQPNDVFDIWIRIPQVEEIFYPLVSVIPLQLFAYYSALARGFDPDKPRNLAKSVTVK